MIDGLSSVPFCGSCEARGKLVVAIVVDHKLAAFLDASTASGSHVSEPADLYQAWSALEWNAPSAGGIENFKG
jgi:hypothetical protein